MFEALSLNSTIIPKPRGGPQILSSSLSFLSKKVVPEVHFKGSEILERIQEAAGECFIVEGNPSSIH